MIVLPGPFWPSSNSTLSASGKVYQGENANDGVGTNLGIFDFDGDGYKDFLSYNSLASPGGLMGAGSMYLVYGGSSFAASGSISSVGVRINGSAAGDGFGQYVVFKDLTGDAKKEFISYSPGADPSSMTDAGSVFIVGNPGTPIVDGTYTIGTIDGKRIDGNAASAEFGSFYAFGDHDGDGMTDLLLGPSSGVATRIYKVLKGQSSFSSIVSQTIFTISSVGQYLNFLDFNSDGKDEIIIGGGTSSSNGLNSNGGLTIINSEFPQ